MKILAALMFHGILVVSSGWAAAKPNIVVVLTDDQGWGDLGMNGNSNLSTPQIDSLARDGASFDRFYVCPVCSPTRAEFLTGRYHSRGGVYSTSAGGERLDLDEQTIADVFKAAGYATGAFGKWHNGMQYPYHPNGRGFEEYYGFCSGHWGNYFSPPLEHNGKLVKGNGFVVDDFTDKAMEFMEKSVKAGKPFFAYLPYNTPHSPMQVPDRWWDKFKDKELKLRHCEPKKENIGHTRAALAMCENVDWNVGRLLAKIDKLKVRDDTIVIYFCDNGPNGSRWNGGMRGRKGSTDEGGVRSPMLVRWPGKIAPKTQVAELGSAIDLLPTLADLAGIPIEGGKALDGVSLKPAILGGDVSQFAGRLIFSHWRGRTSVRTPRFRLDMKGRLYDMKSDQGQSKNVADAHPEVAKRLRAAVAKWKREVAGELGKDERTFPVGHPDYRYAQIPARDAKVSGGIERSNKFPNCSYFRNWKSTDDSISWPIEVLETGDYEVEMYYTCPKTDIGSVIDLKFNRHGLMAQIMEAHDPPEIGAGEDRVKRMESYVKDFRPMRLGTIRLEKGKGDLILKASKIPGAQVAEFRLLMLTRAGG